MSDFEAPPGYELLPEPASASGLLPAQRAEDGRRVAIKRLPGGLPPIPRARLAREVRGLTEVDSPHLARALEVFLDASQPSIVLPWIAGPRLDGSLEEARSAGREFPLPQAFDWARQIAHGLAAAHRKGIVLGDLQPSRIALDGATGVVIMDLDLERAEEADAGRLDFSGAAVSAYRYFAPEQYSGRKVTTCTDVYRWGLVVYEMLSGSLPHESGDAIVDLKVRCEKGAPPLSFHDPRLDGLARIVRRCLDPEPMLRETDGVKLHEVLETLTVTGAAASTPVRADDPIPPSDMVVGGYAITGKLGEGGMGIVYEGKHPTSGQRAAIKVLNPRIATNSHALRRFRREVKLLVNMASQRLVRALGFGDLPQGPYVIMEHIPGRALSDILEREGALSPRSAIILFQDLAEGLRDLHAKNVLHRDLKPANLLVDVDGRGHILDLGIAKDLEASPLTGVGMPLGTPGYLSPEMSRHEPVGPPADVFQAGLILYEMVTGRKDGRAPEAAVKLRAALAAHPGLQSTAGFAWIESVVGLFARTIDPEPKRRHAGGAELLNAVKAIREALEGDEGLAPARVAAPRMPEYVESSQHIPLPAPPATEAPLAGVATERSSRGRAAPWVVLALVIGLLLLLLAQSSST